MRSRQAELLVQEHRPNTSVTSSRVARRFARQPRLTAGLLVFAFAAIVLGHAADGLHAQPAVRDPLTWLGRIERGGAIEEFMALGIAARGNYLFVARSYELDVFDVTVPTRPAKVASLDHPTVPTLASEFARENWMRLDGSLLFLAGSPPVIIDVADPRAPRLVSVLANDVSASAVAVAGSRAYVVQHSVLQIFDIADPSAPVLMGEEIGGGESPISMAVDGTDVLLWRMFGGVFLDASDPSAIRRKAQFRLAMDREYCEQDEARQRRSIAYRGQRAYVTCGRHLGIIDFTRPPTTTDNGLPSYTESGLFETQQFATHVTLLGDRVLLTDLQYLYVLDARDPEHIVELARFEHTVASGDAQC